MTIEHPAWCLGTEQEGEPHTSAVVHAAAPTDVADIRMRLIQLMDVVSIKMELMEDDMTNLYILPLEQTQALVATAAGLLAYARRPLTCADALGAGPT